jgi:nucleoside-diphosphate-sugar epimerase
MRILVIGAGGFIGIPTCRELVQRGHAVTALDRWFFGRKPNGCVVAHGDIRTLPIEWLTLAYEWQMESSLDVPKYRPAYDGVVDLCGLSNDASADIDPELTQSINLEGGKRLATMAKDAGIKRYIYASSASVYGHGAAPDLKETDECKPLTLYAKCKLEVEDHIRNLSGDGFEPVILRNATVFGVAPRMRFDLVANLMTLNAFRDRQIIVRGGEQWRPMVHVNDVARAIATAVEFPRAANQTFNVGYRNFTINEIARTVRQQVPWAEIVRVKEAVDHRDYHLSFEKYRIFLNHTPEKSLGFGVKEVVEALRDEEISGDDPTTNTLSWYRQLLDWDKRLADLRLDGRIL